MNYPWKYLLRSGIVLLLFQAVTYARTVFPPLPCETIILGNGLRVVFMEKHDSPAVALRAYVHVGSIYEGAYLGCGISHYTEHLVSGGATRTRSEHESVYLMKELGDEANAYTTFDHTCYHITTTRDQWRTAAELLADWLGNSTFKPEQVAREKEVIDQEILMDEEEPGSVLWKLTQSTAYLRSPLHMPVIGYAANFRRITRDDLLKFYREHYCANNMVLAIAGDVYRNELEGILKATFGQLPRGPGVTHLIPAEPRHVPSRTAFRRFNVKQAHVELSFPSITLDDPDLYALDLLAEILGAGESALLVKKLKHEQKLVYTISASSWTPQYERGLFSVSITCHETNVQTVVNAVCRELAALAETPVDDRDLERARRKVLVSYFRGLQTAEGLASDLGENLLSLGDPQFGVRYAERLQQVTAADIQEVAAAYLVTNTLVCTGLLPGDTGGMHQAPAVEKKWPEKERFTVQRLSNGIRVAWQRDTTLPLAAMCLYLPAGQECETADTCGMSDFLSRMLTRGTRTRTAAQIADEIDRLGASLSYRSTRSGIAGSVECLAEDTRVMLELLADTALNSAFPEGELEKQRALSLAAIKAQYDSWSYEGYINFYSVFFAGHPYALPPKGDTNVISQLSRTELQAFHERVIQPSNIVIAAAGAFESDELLAWCETYFGLVRSRSTPLARPAQYTPHTDNRMHTRGSTREQATVVLGYPGPVLSDPGRYAVELADGFLGGLSGRLFQDLRMKHDLVYILGSFPFIQDSVGGVIALAQCEPRNARTVLAVMTNAYSTLRVTPLTDDQLASARNSLLVPKMLERETLSGRVTEAAKWEYFGPGANYAGLYAREMAEVNAGDIQRAANTWFTQWTCVVTTPNDVQFRVRAFLDAYPESCAQDIYKIVFQGTCGPGHLGVSKETVTANLEKEWNAVEPEDGPVWFPIALNNDWAWFNLKAWKYRKGDLAPVSEALWQSIRNSRMDHEAVAQNWQVAAGLIEKRKLLPADSAWREFNTQVREEHYPVRHHSEKFIQAYNPAYRVLSKHIWNTLTADDSRKRKMVQ